MKYKYKESFVIELGLMNDYGNRKEYGFRLGIGELLIYISYFIRPY